MPCDRRHDRPESRTVTLTEKLNLLVQGTAADGLKLASGFFGSRRQECPSAVPVLAVNDEIVAEGAAAAADAVRA